MVYRLSQNAKHNKHITVAALPSDFYCHNSKRLFLGRRPPCRYYKASCKSWARFVTLVPQNTPIHFFFLGVVPLSSVLYLFIATCMRPKCSMYAVPRLWMIGHNFFKFNYSIFQFFFLICDRARELCRCRGFEQVLTSFEGSVV